MNTISDFLKAILTLIFKLAKGLALYTIILSMIMLATLSISTGQFPPPVAKYYQNLKSLQTTFQQSPDLAKTLQAKRNQNKILESLDQDTFTKNSKKTSLPNENSNNEVTESSCDTEVKKLKAQILNQQRDIWHLKSALSNIQTKNQTQ